MAGTVATITPDQGYRDNPKDDERGG